MAWETTLVTMVRAIIGDMSASPTYTDARIQTALATAGLIVAQEYPHFTNEYSFDLATPDITPDPTDTNTLDQEAMALFSLKASCMLNLNTYQTAVGAGIKVRDGDSEVDTTGSFRGYQDIIKLGPCASYTKLLESLTIKKSMGLGGAVFSPYSNSTDSSWGASGGFNTSWNLRGFYDSWYRW